ncbi:MAG: TolC family protein [Planctomycetes bacterium]|nr:TolC family protein [Planctomycetota bacterium]
MANSKGAPGRRTPCTAVIGFLVIAGGCSLLPDQTDGVRSRSELRCTTRVVDRDASHEMAQEDPNPGGELVADDANEVALASGQTANGQSTPLLSLPEVLPREEPATEELPPEGAEVKVPEATEQIPTPKPESTATPLQLQDVIDSVYSSYPLLEAAILSRNIADGELLSSQGAFDLKLKGGGTSGPLGFYRTNRFGAGASQPLFLGGEIFGGYKVGRGNFQPWFGERETNDGGEFSAGFAVPLGQNRQIDERRAALFRATYGRDAVEPDIQTQVLAFVWEASYAYWQWVAAGENYQIAQSLLEIAQQRNDGLNKRVDAGDLPRIEMTDNQRLIVSRQAILIDAQRKLQQSAIKLSLFLRTPNGEPIVPVEAQLPAEFPEALSVDLEQMVGDIQLAMSNRPELVFLGLLRMQLDIDLAQARNLYLPSVDAMLFASKDMGEAASPKRDKTPFELEASLQVSVPLQRRKARGKRLAIEGKLQQLSAKIGFTQDKIATEIQQVYAARSAAYERIAKARESLELASTMEQAERRKFDLGDSNLLLVNLREQATADAAKNVVQAMLDYFQAQADYRAAMASELNTEIAS